MNVIDAPVLDYGFQPIINRLTKHPLDIAMSMAIGGAVMISLGMILSALRLTESLIMNFLVIFGQGFAVGLLNSCFHQLRQIIVPGIRNPLRYLLTTTRITAGLITVAIVAFNDGMLVGDLMSLGAFLWCACFYFESCDCPPHKPARVRAPSQDRTVLIN